MLTAVSCAFVAPVASAAEADLEVNVQIVGEEIRATVSLFVKAVPQRVWDVITDYERAPDFMRDLQVSKIVSRSGRSGRSGDTLRVLQKDRVGFGPFSFTVETLKDVRLVEPVKVESRLVSGSMKKYDAKTELVAEAGGTRLLYRSQSIPGSALAVFVSESMVKRETEERFRQLRAEILRRENIAQQSPASPTSPSGSN